jgi:23S rRNA (uridine2552-2'-O)-methyltransferase
VVGIDLTQPDQSLSSNFRFIQADVLTLDIKWLVEEIALRDVVISDLAPQTTGIRSVDTSRSMSLARRAAEIAYAVLKERGHFICKVFEGEDLNHFRAETSTHFRRTKLFRPTATRKGSREIYLVGLEFAK